MKLNKLLCLVLVICMAGALLVGCTAAPTAIEPSAAAEAESEVEAAEAPAEVVEVETEFADAATGKYDGIEGEPYRIGFTYVATTDTLSAAFHKVLDYTAAQFGCEMVYADFNGADMTDPTPQESVVQAGVDGYINVVLTGSLIETFDKAGVYFIQCCMKTENEDLLKMLDASEYFCGMICEFDSGYELCEQIYNAGARNIAYLAPTAGMAASHDARVRGIEEFLAEHPDMNLVTSYRGTEYFTSTAPVDEMLAAFQEIDGMLSSAGVLTVPAAVYAAGRQGSIKYATIDIQEGAADQLKDGFMVGVAGGQYPSMQIAFAVLYEALSTGDMLVADRITPVMRPYVWINNIEDYNNYITYLEGDIPAYTGDELKDLCGFYNKEASLEERQALLISYCENYGLDDVLTRHADLF